MTRLNAVPLLMTGISLLAAFALGCSEHAEHNLAADLQRLSSVGSHRFRGPSVIHALCTTGMVADLVRHVGGERVEVFQLMGEGVDPHLYKSSAQDIRALNAADIVFYSGLHLEGRMTEVLERIRSTKPSIAVAAGIDPSRLLRVSESQFDPHVWFDVQLWIAALRVVERALCEFDPSNAEEYRRRSTETVAEWTQLDDYCRQSIAAIPKESRVLVTAHDAFSYFGRAYAMEVRAIQGVSTESEAGVREINALVEFLATRRIKAVFVESSVSDRNVKALVEGCKSLGHRLVVGGELYSDAMGKAGTPEGTYAGMVRHNVDTIVRALR